jgi:hypothetical protein
MEAVSADPGGGSASRSRASQDKGLAAGLSGAGMEMLSRYPLSLHLRWARLGCDADL